VAIDDGAVRSWPRSVYEAALRELGQPPAILIRGLNIILFFVGPGVSTAGLAVFLWLLSETCPAFGDLALTSAMRLP